MLRYMLLIIGLLVMLVWELFLILTLPISTAWKITVVLPIRFMVYPILYMLDVDHQHINDWRWMMRELGAVIGAMWRFAGAMVIVGIVAGVILSMFLQFVGPVLKPRHQVSAIHHTPSTPCRELSTVHSRESISSQMSDIERLTCGLTTPLSPYTPSRQNALRKRYL